jgi:phage terminase large subunit-like protein
MAGRGFGKTRTGAETIRQWVKENRYRRIALIADTETEARHIMVEGDSGLLTVHSSEEQPKYEPSKRRLTWTNGAIATLFTAENYEQLRGAQFDCVWIDELAKFRYAMEMWDQMNFGLRIGQDPRIIVTTTPRPNDIIHMLLEGEGDWVTITRGTTFDNAANLSPSFITHIKKRYEGTSLGDQELHGHVLSDVEGALWQHKTVESLKVREIPLLKRVVVAVDPATTSSASSSETGIIVAGVCNQGHAYILQDLSGKYTPTQWANRAIGAYYNFKADRLIAEINQGGDMVKSIIHSLDPRVSYKNVHACRHKVLRAEPVLALYEQRKIFHARFGLEALEEQMCTYVPSSKKSPDRLDALVWAVTELLLTGPPQGPPRAWVV